MKNTLYKIADEYLSALDSVEDGELYITTASKIDILEHSLTEKATNVAAYIRNTEELAKSIKEAEAQMRKRRQAMEARIRRLREYLLANMEKTGITKVECPWFKIGIRKNPDAVDVFDIQEVPDDTVNLSVQMTRDQYLRILYSLTGLDVIVTEVKADKKELKRRLEAGENIKGAELTQSYRVQIT